MFVTIIIIIGLIIIPQRGEGGIEEELYSKKDSSGIYVTSITSPKLKRSASPPKPL